MFWFWWFWKRLTLPAWAFLPYWMGLQLLSIAMGAQDGFAVHVGSFAAGAIAAIIWKTTHVGADEKLIEFKRLAFEPDEPKEKPTAAGSAPMRKTAMKSKVLFAAVGTAIFYLFTCWTRGSFYQPEAGTLAIGATLSITPLVVFKAPRLANAWLDRKTFSSPSLAQAAESKRRSPWG